MNGELEEGRDIHSVLIVSWRGDIRDLSFPVVVYSKPTQKQKLYAGCK